MLRIVTIGVQIWLVWLMVATAGWAGWQIAHGIDRARWALYDWARARELERQQAWPPGRPLG
jgi:hypothetical protein